MIKRCIHGFFTVWFRLSAVSRLFLFGVFLVIATLCFLNYRYPLKPKNLVGDFSQVVRDKDNEALRTFPSQDGFWRQKTSFSEVSPYYLQALIHYEDRWFWRHPGINPVALFRAAWQNWRCDCVVSGGSTLTMQVARRFYPHPRTVKGKLQQILRAFQLEWYFTKAQILNLYLNYAPFGGIIEGVEAASYAYLETSAATLTRAEAALLAVLPQAPSRIRPDRYPQRAQLARDKVLERLASGGVWHSEHIDMAKQEQVFATAPRRPRRAPLLSRALALAHPQARNIHTTIDSDAQEWLEEEFREWIATQPKGSSAAVIIVDQVSMAVKAYMGSADFNDSSRFGHVDMVKAIRSPGSTLKPFIYGMAIEAGLIHSQSLLADVPRYDGDYRPDNFGENFSGPVSVTQALRRSLNVPAVNVLQNLGVRQFYSRMTSAGVNLVLPAGAKPNLSLALGGVGTNLWSLVSAYSAFHYQGVMRRPHVLSDLDTKAHRVTGRYLLAPESAWMIRHMLNRAKQPNHLSATGIAQKTHRLSWKTGTSYGYRDAWAIGSQKDYTMGVWLGRPDGTPQPGHFGALNAAPWLFRISDAVEEGLMSAPTPKSAGGSSTDDVGRDVETEKLDIQVRWICWPLGLLESQTLPSSCHIRKLAHLYKGITPKTAWGQGDDRWSMNPIKLYPSQAKKTPSCVSSKALTEPATKNLQTVEIALWPIALEPWINKRWHRKAQIQIHSPECSALPVSSSALKIVNLDDGNIFRSPRGYGTLPQVELEALGGVGNLHWYVNGHFVGEAPARSGLKYSFKSTGKKQILVVDQTGSIEQREVFVELGF